MSSYKHILLAVDFSEYGHIIANKAKQLAQENQATLSLIHVVDNQPMSDANYGPIIPFDGDITELLMKAEQKTLTKLAD
jgi:universal stress protein A